MLAILARIFFYNLAMNLKTTIKIYQSKNIAICRPKEDVRYKSYPLNNTPIFIKTYPRA